MSLNSLWGKGLVNSGELVMPVNLEEAIEESGPFLGLSFLLAQHLGAQSRTFIVLVSYLTRIHAKYFARNHSRNHSTRINVNGSRISVKLAGKFISNKPWNFVNRRIIELFIPHSDEARDRESRRVRERRDCEVYSS